MAIAERHVSQDKCVRLALLNLSITGAIEPKIQTIFSGRHREPEPL